MLLYVNCVTVSSEKDFMGNQKINTNEESLNELRRKIRVVHIFFKILFIVSVVLWVAVTVYAIYDVFGNLSSSEYLGQSLVNLITVTFIGAAILVLFRMVVVILTDVSKGRPIFSQDQVKRTRIIAIMFVIYGCIDSVLTSNFSSWVFVDGFGFGGSSVGGNSEVMISFNMGAFIAAVVIYSISLVFEYGTELQQQSDSIL